MFRGASLIWVSGNDAFSALAAIATWADQRAVLPAVLLTFDAKTSRAEPPAGKVPPP
jgi:hypothetical protein